MGERTLDLADSARHENNFNVIRLCAAISVLFGHAYPIMGDLPDPTSRFFGPANHYIGDAAVDVFFITSGFLLAKSAMKGESILQFIKNRILRIYPALIVCNIIVILACWGIFNNFSAAFLHNKQTLHYALYNSLMFYNSTAEFTKNTWLPHSFTNVRIGLANGSLWTLAAEIKAYLLMISAMAIASVVIGAKWRRMQPAIWVTLLLISLFCFAYLPLVGGEPLFKRLFVFFFAGAVLYSVRSFVQLDWRLAMIAVLSLWVVKSDAPMWYSAASYLIYPYLVAYIAYGLPFARRINSIGDFSYGVYIYGWFVQNLIASLSGMSISPVANFLASTVISLAFAVPSWFLLEKPLLNLKKTRLPVASTPHRTLPEAN